MKPVKGETEIKEIQKELYRKFYKQKIILKEGTTTEITIPLTDKKYKNAQLDKKLEKVPRFTNLMKR